jgi:hypothetical protein
MYKELQNASKNATPIVSFTNANKEPDQLSLTEYREYSFISSQQKKSDYESSFSNSPSKSNIRFEYMEKTILYGYIIVGKI